MDVEALQLRPRDPTTMQKLKEAENKHAYHKAKFERLRGDVSIKMRFLDENRVSNICKNIFINSIILSFIFLELKVIFFSYHKIIIDMSFLFL